MRASTAAGDVEDGPFPEPERGRVVGVAGARTGRPHVRVAQSRSTSSARTFPVSMYMMA